jgi:hypothetical protein
MIYELRIGTFADSNADGIGDFRRPIKKLDYLADMLPDFGDGVEGGSDCTHRQNTLTHRGPQLYFLS